VDTQEESPIYMRGISLFHESELRLVCDKKMFLNMIKGFNFLPSPQTGLRLSLLCAIGPKFTLLIFTMNLLASSIFSYSPIEA
jgi:hypothetical protein